MPETPDFASAAAEIIAATEVSGPLDRLDLERLLVKIWNARGAADAQAINTRLSTLTGWVTSEPYRQHLREAITALDRTDAP